MGTYCGRTESEGQDNIGTKDPHPEEQHHQQDHLQQDQQHPSHATSLPENVSEVRRRVHPLRTQQLARKKEVTQSQRQTSHLAPTEPRQDEGEPREARDQPSGCVVGEIQRRGRNEGEKG